MESKITEAVQAIKDGGAIDAVLATIPTAAIFFLMQKQFVAGMTGAVKG